MVDMTQGWVKGNWLIKKSGIPSPYFCDGHLPKSLVGKSNILNHQTIWMSEKDWKGYFWKIRKIQKEKPWTNDDSPKEWTLSSCFRTHLMAHQPLGEFIIIATGGHPPSCHPKLQKYQPNPQGVIVESWLFRDKVRIKTYVPSGKLTWLRKIDENSPFIDDFVTYYYLLNIW